MMDGRPSAALFLSFFLSFFLSLSLFLSPVTAKQREPLILRWDEWISDPKRMLKFTDENLKLAEQLLQNAPKKTKPAKPVKKTEQGTLSLIALFKVH